MRRRKIIKDPDGEKDLTCGLYRATIEKAHGKTGMGKSHGIVVDAWFTGFAETAGRRIYFCVYLGETEDKNVSSTKAKEIAAEIVSAYLMSGNGQW